MPDDFLHDDGMWRTRKNPQAAAWDEIERRAAERDAALARVAEAERLLRNLRNQTRGGLWLEPESIQEVIGVPNFRAIEQGIAEADAFLAAALPAAPPEPPTWKGRKVAHPPHDGSGPRLGEASGAHDLWLGYTIDDDGIHLQCSCGLDQIVGSQPSPAEAAEAARAHLGAPPEPPPLPAEVRRVVEAAEEWDQCVDDPAKHYKLVHAHWKLRESVAALRASREKGGSGG